MNVTVFSWSKLVLKPVGLIKGQDLPGFADGWECMHGEEGKGNGWGELIKLSYFSFIFAVRNSSPSILSLLPQ